MNVSDSGLLARFKSPPEPWIDGQLIFEAGDHYFGIPARVARVQGNDVGFAFSICTEQDRAGIGILLHSVSELPLEEEPPG